MNLDDAEKLCDLIVMVPMCCTGGRASSLNSFKLILLSDYLADFMEGFYLS